MAQQGAEIDTDDWRACVARAGDLVARRQAKEAVVAARRAVALAPDEPEARLALADALLAVYPRRIGNRAAAFAEIDQAELLGVDAREPAERREQPKGMGYTVAVWVAGALFMGFGLHGLGGRIGTVVAWPAMVLFLIGTGVVRVRPEGRSLREALDTKRKLSRRRLAAGEQLGQRAPLALAVLAFLDLPTAFLAIPGVDGKAQPLLAAWVLLCGIPVIGLAAWIGVDQWLRPGTVSRALRRDAFLTCSVLITFVLAELTAVLAVRRIQSSGLWFALFVGQMAWILISVVVGVIRAEASS